MKNKHPGVGQLVTLTLAIALGVSALAVVSVAETSPNLSKKELKTLLATATTPADHQRIAAYHRSKAQRLTAKAQEFSAQADYVATQPGAIDPKQRISLQIAGSRYRYLAKQYAQEAKESEALAAQQVQLSDQNQSTQTQN
jgi:hypothetical protein